MATYSVYKETALPATLEANAIYLITASGNTDYLEVYVANQAGDATRRLPTEADIQALINLQVDAVNNVRVADDITDRDALTGLPTNVKVIVIDATDDPSVDSGGAEYVSTDGGTTWTKTSESESMDAVLNWSNIVGGPTSSPANIDDAVTKRHVHANKTELDKISEDADGHATYAGDALVITGSINW